VPALRAAPVRRLVRAGDMALLGEQKRGVEAGSGASERPDCSKKQTHRCKKPVSADLEIAGRGLNWPTLAVPAADDGSNFVHA
jgi:hypothetical protein